MRVEVRAFIPSHDPIGKLLDRQRLPRAGRELTYFGKAALKHLQSYPPQAPPPPGRRRYKRTKRLKGGWQYKELASKYEVVVKNRVKYAVWVQGQSPGSAYVGPKQRTLFYYRDWPNLTDVKTKIWPKYRVRIAKALGVRTVPPYFPQ